MKTIPTLMTMAILLFSFFFGNGAQTSFAQESKKEKIVYTSPPISFLYFDKLTDPLQTEVRMKMMAKILNEVKKDANKKVADLKQDTQGGSLSPEYYEVSKNLSGRKITVQYIPPTQGKNAGNISFSWYEKDEKGKTMENWFVFLSLDGFVETAIDSKWKKMMISSGGKITVGTKHQLFWQLQADQILRELHQELSLTGKLE